MKAYKKHLTQLTQQLNVNELVKECSNQINSLNFSSGSHYHRLLKIQRLHLMRKGKQKQKQIVFKPAKHYGINTLITQKSKQDSN